MITNRIELAGYFSELGFKLGAEIGVADGRYAEILCKEIPDLRLMCVDPWAKYDGNWRNDEYQDRALLKAIKRLEGYRIDFNRNTSVSASIGVDDNSLDFVFIDGAHDFDNVILDIILWTRKVRNGGIVSGHDYYQFNGGVIPAVNAYVEAHNLDLNLTLRNTGGHRDDQCPCWWFVKK